MKDTHSTLRLPLGIVCTLVTLFVGSLNAQIIERFAGNTNQGFSGDGTLANSSFVEFSFPSAVYHDKAGNVYIADEENNVVRIVTTNGIINTFAGNHTLGAGYSGDGGPATAGQLSSPTGVWGDSLGNIYIVEYANSILRKVNSSGILSTVAGTAIRGFSGDGGPATAAQFKTPLYDYVDSKGNIYISDFGNNRLREINTSGIINTIAGNGAFGFSGDNGPATAAEIDYATGICTDDSENVYFTDLNNSRIRKVNTSGIISTIAGNGINSYSGDGGPATAAELQYPWDVKMDTMGNMFFVDSYNQRVREINTTGIISTIAGDGYISGGYTGDGGPATDAELNYPSSICLDNFGDVYFSDQGNQIIREIVYGTVTFVETLQSSYGIRIFPNPNNGTFTLSISNIPDSYRDENYIVEIYNILGEQMLTETLRSAQGDSPIAIGLINLTGQPDGIYLYRVITENGGLVGEGKLVIQK